MDMFRLSCSQSGPFLPFMACHKSDTSGTRTAYPPGTTEFSPGSRWVRVAQSPGTTGFSPGSRGFRVAPVLEGFVYPRMQRGSCSPGSRGVRVAPVLEGFMQPRFQMGSCSSIFIFLYCVLSNFVLFFFFWPLYCLSSFNVPFFLLSLWYLQTFLIQKYTYTLIL